MVTGADTWRWANGPTPFTASAAARLTEPDPAKLTIGQQMELVIKPLGVDSDGNQTMIYAFAPVEAAKGTAQ